MALTGPAITAALEASRLAGVSPLLGLSYSQIALAVGTALQGWAIGQPQNLSLVGGSVGSLGPGIILPASTRLFVPPEPTVVQSGLASVGIVGPTSTSVSTAIAVGLSQVFSTLGQYSGTSTVSAGADISKVVVANPATLTALMVPIFLGIVGPGPVSGQLAAGLSNGITGLLLLGTGVGVVTPAPGAPPPTPPAVPGITTSVVV